ncbi:MAG: hypothetical protein ACE5OT_04225 [Candidatus Hadarchaeaceae archaeon]
MKYRRWLLVGYLLALMAFTTSVLLIPGEKYKTLTTSDSGWFYDIAADIAETHGMVESNRLSHAPYGKSVRLTDQAQPLITVMLYGGVHALNPSVSLMDVVRYWGPLLFALTLIPIFLIGKELGGDLGGCTAAFFAATMTSSIYWHKFGVYDREPIQLILAAWTIYLTLKLFKAPRSSIPRFGLFAGMVFGLFGLAWRGAFYIAPIIIGALLLALLSERLRWLPIILVGAFLLLTGFLGSIFRGGGTPGDIINLFIILIGGLVFAAIIEIFLHKASVESLFRGILSSVRTNIFLIAGVLGMLAVTTLTLWAIGGQSPIFWRNFAQTILGSFGIGGAGKGVSIARYASEMAPPRSWGDTVYRMYGGNPGSPWTLSGNAAILTVIAFTLVVVALAWLCWHKRRAGMLALPWFIVLIALVWPGSGSAQVRFERMWWLFVPVLAGAGSAALVSLLQRVSFEQLGDWLRYFQKPLVFAFLASLVATPFIFNAYAVARGTTPPTEWRGGFGWRDEGFMDVFTWLRDNTPENSIVAIQWSYGHLLTGVSRRPTVVDGTETFGEEGKWENLAGIKPPDYIYYVRNGRGYTYGLDREAPIRPYKVNGRRIDVQRFPTMDKDEFQWILGTYRDNYDCKIDYVIFDALEYNSARDYYKYTLPANILLNAERIDIRLESEPSIDGQTYVFNFGENRQSIVLDQQARDVYLRTDNVNLHLDGYGFLGVDEVGNVGIVKFDDAFPFFPPPSTVDIPETLLVFVDADGNPVTAWLIEAVSAEIAARPIPMATHVFTNDIGDIDYLQIAYTSSNGWVKVLKINHVPSLISPAEGARTNDSTLEFKWSGAVGAVKYELWVDNNADFASPEIRENLSTTMYTPTSELADGTYSWRVLAFRADNTELGWSPTWTFAVDTQAPGSPQLLEPENNTELNTLRTTFAWTKPEPNLTYGIQIDDEASFFPPYVYGKSGIRENSYTYLFPHNGTYYWRVQAFDRAGNASEWSNGYKLIIRAPPKAPTLTTPADGAITNDNTSTFGWAGGNADNYRLLVDDDSEFSSPEVDVFLGITDSYTIADEEALSDDDYYWKVIASVRENQDSSSVWRFIVDTTPPVAATLHAPENGTTTSDNTPTFEWTVGVGAAKHRLLIGVDPNFSQLEVDTLIDIPENTYTPSPLADDNYWWEVIAIDRAGNESESSIWTFTVQT